MTARTEKSLATKTVINSAFQVAGVLGASLVSLVTFAVITRSLGPTSFGHYSAALALLLIPSVVSDVGLSAIVLRDISERPDITARMVSASLTARALLAVVAFSVTLAISWFLPFPRETKVAALVATSGAVILVINGGLLPALQAELRMHWAMQANISGRLIALGVTLIALQKGYGLYAVLLAYALGNAVTLLVDFVGVRRRVALSWVFDLRSCWSLARGSFMVGGALLVGSLYFRIDTVLLAAIRPPAEVGLYAAGYKFFDLSLLIVGAVALSVFPHLTRVIASGRSADDVRRILNILFALGTVISVIVFVDARHLVNLASGADYSDAAIALRILAPAIPILFVNVLLERMLVSAHCERALLLVSGVALAINISLNLALLPTYGYKAAAAVTLGCEIVWLTLALVAISRSFDYLPRPSVAPRVAGAAALALVVLVVLPGPWPLVGAVAAIGYVLVLVLFPGPGRRDLLACLPPALRSSGIRTNRRPEIT